MRELFLSLSRHAVSTNEHRHGRVFAGTLRDLAELILGNRDNAVIRKKIHIIAIVDKISERKYPLAVCLFLYPLLKHSRRALNTEAKARMGGYGYFIF